MATYHEPHKFQPGAPTRVWNAKTHKHEFQPSPIFCAVCGRKVIHELHTQIGGR